jgi:hypothetical protein
MELGVKTNLKTSEELKLEGQEFLKQKKLEEPTLVDTGLAAIRTSLTGGNTFLNMVENKTIMPSNDGDKLFNRTPEFESIVSEMAPNISLSDLQELKEAKNPEYLKLKIANQQRYKEAIDTIDKAGATGMVVETVMSFADAPSWLVGGAVFKAGQTFKSAMGIQSTGAQLLTNMGIGSAAASSAIYASEKAIQAEAGVDMQERANTMAKYGAAFGMALPLVAQTFTSVATQNGRQSIANNTGTLINNLPGKGGLRGFFSMSSSDQLVNQGTSEFSRNIGNLATTRVNAAKDADGNFVTASDDTAMDYTQTVIEREVTNLHYGALENSQKTGNDMVQQSFEDGKSWNEFTNSVEQTVRRDIGNMTDDELIATYKEATGIEELPIERVQRQTQTKLDQVDNDFRIASDRINTARQTDINKETQLEFSKREKTRQTKLKNAQEQLTKETESTSTQLQKDLVYVQRIEAGDSVVKTDSKAYKAAKDRINKSQTRLQKLQTKVDELSVETVIDEDFISRTTKNVDKKYQPTLNKLEQTTKKSKAAIEKERQKASKETLPEDLYDVVQAHKRSKGFDDGIFVPPASLQYIQDFYSKFGEDATKYQLKGIAGKDSRGYGHVKYNSDEIMSDIPGAEAKFKEMLRDDELNKKLIRDGKLTEEELDKIAKDMVENALDRDFLNKYLDGGKGAQATSATKRRKLRMNRALYPELFVNDINVIGTEYADKIGGKIGLKKVYGLDTDNLGRMSSVIDEQLKKVVEEGRKNGASERAIKKDVENVRAIFETVLGSRKYNKDPDAAINKTSRMLRKGASALYNAGFVKYALVEPTVAVLRYGLKPVLDNFVPAIKATQDQIKNAKPTDPLVKAMRQAGLAIQIQRGAKYDRYDNMEITPTTGKTEMFLDKTAHYARKYSGFNYVNDVSDFVAGGASLSELQTVMTKKSLSKAEASRLARYGLSSDDLVKLNRQDIKRSDDGQVTDWNYDNWKDQDLAKKFIRYLGRATRDTIMRADGTRVHRWQSDVNNPLAAMGLQFTQMPVALYERLLLNLGDEVSTRTAVGMISAVGIMYSILKLEDMALVQAGVNDKLEDDTTLLIKAATRTPMAGIVPNFIDTGLILTGNSPLGSAFAPRQDIGSMFLGAGYGVGNKLLKTGIGLSDGINETDASNFLKITPAINSIIGLNIGTKAVIKDLKDAGKVETNTPLTFDRPMYEFIANEE